MQLKPNFPVLNANVLTSLFTAAFLFLLSCSQPAISTVAVDGEWSVALDRENVGEKEEWYKKNITDHTINLPGTLAEADLGDEPDLTPKLTDTVMFHLARNKYYTGKTWYQKEIELPVDWSEATTELTFERILWQSKVWINGQPVGSESSVSTPHRYRLADVLRPGKNTITVLVDNSFIEPGISFQHPRYPTAESIGFSHAYSNHTQGKWNGIIGKMELRKVSSQEVSSLELRYNATSSTLAMKATFDETLEPGSSFTYVIRQDENVVANGEVTAQLSGKTATAAVDVPAAIERWSELSPTLYTISFGIKGQSQYETTFGFRDIAAVGEVLTLNDQRIFLRGNLDCAVYPIKGRVDMDRAAWETTLNKIKAYGFNHIRFHSWCPPTAAFEVADKLGMYLQAELPHWSLTVGEDTSALEFLAREADLILAEYGNHPSFVLMSLGNELEGDMGWLNSQVARLKQKDPHRLYTTTTFSFQKGVGIQPQPEDEFLVTQWTDRGWVRGQGYFNDFPPNFAADYQNRIEHISTPIIAHEIGQYAVFPSLKELDSYTGVAQPVNLLAVKNDLEKKGMLAMAPDFARASGQLAGLLYKADIERNLKTPSYDGFQVLQLQDYPGHGTALIGLLDVFLNSKGIMDEATFRSFNAPVVPLLRFEKVSYRNGETFKGKIQVANFAAPMENTQIKWEIADENSVLDSGTIEVDIPLGNEVILDSMQSVVQVDQAKQLKVSLKIEGTDYHNAWDIWVFPNVNLPASDVVYTRSASEAEAALQAGKKVLFNPVVDDSLGLPNRFGTIFWGQLLFQQVSNMGLLIDPAHPAFTDFPTSYHSNWQWWDLCTNSRILNLDEVGAAPLVRVIDDFLTNRNLGLVFEAQVGEGKLLLSAIDLDTNLDNRFEAKQLRYSLMKYMSSGDFNPGTELEMNDLPAL